MIGLLDERAPVIVDFGRRLVLGVVVRGLEQAVVARGELERLEPALGGVVRLEADPDLRQSSPRITASTACANCSGCVNVTFGAGFAVFGFATDWTIRVSSVARPGSIVTFSSGVNRLRLLDRTPVAPAAEATETVVCSTPPNRSAPVSNE